MQWKIINKRPFVTLFISFENPLHNDFYYFFLKILTDSLYNEYNEFYT